MGDVIGKIFSVILAVLLLFIYPMMNMLEQQDITTREFVHSEVTLFVDTVRNRGEISEEMISELINKLDATNNIYEIQMVHGHQSVIPIYSDPLDLNSFEGTYEVHTEEYFTKEIYSYLDTNNQPYPMTQGDSFKITVSNQNKTFATKVLQLIYGRELPTQTILVTYGGIVK